MHETASKAFEPISKVSKERKEKRKQSRGKGCATLKLLLYYSTQPPYGALKFRAALELMKKFGRLPADHFG